MKQNLLSSQINDFNFSIQDINEEYLKKTINWINEQLDPDMVFDDDILKSWIAQKFDPEDIFSKRQLEEWAEFEGFKKEED